MAKRITDCSGIRIIPECPPIKQNDQTGETDKVFDGFTEDMSIEEAQLAFFKAIDGKTKEEKEKIWAEYEKIFPTIFHNSLKKNEGYLV